jgi:hypothetical protein
MKSGIKDGEGKMHLECGPMQERQNTDVDGCLEDYEWMAGWL